MLKLHFGCGPRVLKGWINIDKAYQSYEPYLDYYGNDFYPPELRGTINDFMALDVVKAPLPFENDSVDIIFHEDFIEHLDQRQSLLFLAETFRILKPGAIQRVNTPDLLWSLITYGKPGQGYYGIHQDEWLTWGHNNLFSQSYLKAVAEAIGFEIRFQQRDVSISTDIPREFRPGSDRDDFGNIFADLIKPNSTNVKNNAEIIYNTHRTRNSSVNNSNLDKSDKVNREFKLDIACGKNKKVGFTGVDIWDGADIIADLEKFPWPFEDNSVDEVFCSHYIEHTPDLILFANELYRIMKVGAKAEIIAPYYSSIRAWQDPTHLRAISEATFLYFNKEWRVLNKLDHYPITVDFDFEYRFLIDQQWLDKDEVEKQFAIRHYINVVSDIHVILTKKTANDEVSSLLKQATTYWEEGDFNKAISFCEKLLEIENNLEALLMLGEYELKTDSFDTAIDYFLKAGEIDTESFEAHAGLVRALVNSGQLEKAKKHLKELGMHDVDTASQLEMFLDIKSNIDV